MKLSIIILNYNAPLETLNCIRSLFTHCKEEFESKKYEIILVDNKSTDDSVAKIESEIKKRGWKMLFIKSNKNPGFGGGCNTGAKKAKGKYLLFLNPDTIVKDKSIQKMVSFMEDNNHVPILGGRLVNKGVTLDGGGIFPNFYHSLMMLAGLGKDILVKPSKEISKVDWVGGGCMMFNKGVFTSLKGFDENIFMYNEDLEICYRAYKKNYDTYYFPFTNIIHLEGKSSNSSFRIINSYKGYLYFYKKHKSKLEFAFINLLFRLKFKLYSFFSSTYSKI